VSRGAEDSAQAVPTTEEKAAPPAKPYFAITRGNPTPVEVGILSAVFATAEGNAAYAAEHDTGIRDDWGDVNDKLRTPFGYSPGSFLNRRQF